MATGDTSLGTVGIVSKGEYSASTAYVQGNFVLFDGSSYVCINPNGCKGIKPTHDKVNWLLLAYGISSSSLATENADGFMSKEDKILLNKIRKYWTNVTWNDLKNNFTTWGSLKDGSN